MIFKFNLLNLNFDHYEQRLRFLRARYRNHLIRERYIIAPGKYQEDYDNIDWINHNYKPISHHKSIFEAYNKFIVGNATNTSSKNLKGLIDEVFH